MGCIAPSGVPFRLKSGYFIVLFSMPIHSDAHTSDFTVAKFFFHTKLCVGSLVF